MNQDHYHNGEVAFYNQAKLYLSPYNLGDKVFQTFL